MKEGNLPPQKFLKYYRWKQLFCYNTKAEASNKNYYKIPHNKIYSLLFEPKTKGEIINRYPTLKQYTFLYSPIISYFCSESRECALMSCVKTGQPRYCNLNDHSDLLSNNILTSQKYPDIRHILSVKMELQTAFY